MYIVKRIGLLLLFPLIGAVVMYIYGGASLQGAFIKWEPLGHPPEKAVKVVAPGYIQTASGDIYRYDYKQGCADDCWVKSDAPAPDDSKYNPSPNTCRGLPHPALADFVDSKTVCRYYGPGLSWTIEAIDKKGFVYLWENTSGEWSFAVPLIFSLMGAAAGLIIGLIFLLTVLYLDLMKRLQKRAQEKGVSEQV